MWPGELAQQPNGSIEVAHALDALNDAALWSEVLSDRSGHHQTNLAAVNVTGGGAKSFNGPIPTPAGGTANGAGISPSADDAASGPAAQAHPAGQQAPSAPSHLPPYDFISFSHFLPHQALLPEKRFLTFPNLAKAVGSAPLRARLAALRPQLHVFGGRACIGTHAPAHLCTALGPHSAPAGHASCLSAACCPPCHVLPTMPQACGTMLLTPHLIEGVGALRCCCCPFWPQRHLLTWQDA